MILSEQMLNQFNEEAYLHVAEPVFSEHDFKNLKKYLMAFVQALPPAFRTANFANLPQSRPRVADWIGCDPLLKIVEPILGPDIASWAAALCYKPANSKYRVVAHADSHFWIEWGILEPIEVLTLFIPFTEMTKESGCLRVLPKRNDKKLYRHKPVDREYNFFAKEIDDPEVDLSQMIDIEMAPNQVCLLKENLIHSSECNRSSTDRLGLTVRYISTKTRYIQHGSDAHQMFLLKGKNHAGNKYDDLSLQPVVGGFTWS